MRSSRKHIADRLSRLGALELIETTRAGDANAAAANAVEAGIGRVIVAGGDGTVNEVINAIAGKGVALGLIPQGTGNVLARELGIPLDNVEGACDIIQAGRVRSMDLGRANGRYFVAMAGIGFDAAVVDGVDLEMKDIIGPAAYGIAGLRELLRHKATRFTLQIDDKRYETMASLVIVANVGTYAMNLKIAPQAVFDDGLLDICIFEKGGSEKITLLKHAARMLIQGIRPDDANIQCLTAKRVQIESAPRALVQLDGDVVDKTPIDIEVAPSALRVIAPL